MTTRLARIPAAVFYAYAATVRFFDWCWCALLDQPPLRRLRAATDRLCAPLYRRQARHAIREIEQDIAMIAPLGRPDVEARLRQTQDGWVRRLTELG